MANERVRSYDQQGYRLLIDKELPHRGIQVHLLLPDMVVAANGTMQKAPVPTNYTLPNGQEQPFINVAFDTPQLEGLKILNFYNATINMTGNMTGNMTETQVQSMTGNQSTSMAGNQTENLTTSQSKTMTGTQF